MPEEDINALDQKPASFFQPYEWRKYKTLERYVNYHCNKPAQTLAYYQELGVDLRQSNAGGELWYRNSIVADFSTMYLPLLSRSCM